MIEKITTEYPDFDDLKYKVNELVDVVNALVESNNVHEQQIEKLQSIVSKTEKVESCLENMPTDKDFITITADDVLVGGKSVREYNGEKIYNYYHLPAYFKEIRDDVAEKGIKLLRINCLQSSTDGEYAEKGNPTPDKNGCSVWCRCVWEKDGKIHIGVWVFSSTYSSAADCASYCADYCAYNVRGRASFRSAVFGGLD